ncbi:MAG: CofC family guanylyltransferase [Solirubrobacteraceae bacterium]
MPTAAILPVKRFDSAKQRLGESLADDVRVQLAQAMLVDVLQALGRCAALSATIVVTAEERARSAALAGGALVEQDTSDSGQSAAVALGVQRALSEGFRRVLCVPGDCPTLHPAEVDTLLGKQTHGDAPDDREGKEGKEGKVSGSVLIVPDRHGTGTNALLLHPPDVIEPSFGPNSFARHQRLARDAGVPALVMRPPSLLLDIDTGADLDELRRRLAQAGQGAARTRALLCGEAPLER